jgi:hypothetical protein
MPKSVTNKQLVANRQNAKLGGVKTDEGKAISKLNALKHGILSREVLLADEDEETLIEFGKRIRCELKAAGEIEMLLADRIIANMWRLRRVLVVERNTMEWQANHQGLDFDLGSETEGQAERKKNKNMIDNPSIERILRYEIAIERSLYKALHELQRIQAANAGEKPPAPVAIDIDISNE